MMVKFGGEIYRRILAVLGILTFGAIVCYGGVEALRQVAQVNPLYLVCAFIAAGLAAVVTSLRWGMIVDALEGRRAHTRLEYFYYVMMGKLSSTFVSQYVGDYGVRPLALRASGNTSMVEPSTLFCWTGSSTSCSPSCFWFRDCSTLAGSSPPRY